MKRFIWTKEKCKEEASKYSSKKEFFKESRSAYNASLKNHWLNDYNWLIDGKVKWIYKTCKEEAKKYSSRNEFRKGSRGAYLAACKNNWLKDYDWFKERFIWTKERCFEEAKKYSLKGEFSKGSRSAYCAALRNNWIDDYFWLKEAGLYKNDHIYSYEFTDLKSVYVGRTVEPLRRDYDHRTRKDTVSSFTKEHNIPIPKMKILEEGITVKEGKVKEGIWKDKYEKEGWIILNKVKTGGVGSFASKWTYKRCYEEAKNYSSRKKFQKGNQSAYNVALKNNWLDDYKWFEERFIWTKEKCYKEAKKYFSRYKFKKGSRGAYLVAWKNKWLDEFFPKIPLAS